MSFFSRLAALFRKRRLDDRVDEEMRFHLEMQIEENISRGMSPQEARRQARISSGGLEQAKELHRDARGLPFFESLWQDLRFAVRSLRRTPGVTASALLTLTFGIGIGTTIFSLVYAVLLRDLPYKEPDRLVVLWSANPEGGPSEDLNQWMPVSEYLEWEKQPDIFESMTAFNDGFAGIITDVTPPEFVVGQMTTAGFFETLGVQPALGRPFSPEELETGAPVAILLNDIWQKRFAADPDIIGKTIRLRQNQRLTVDRTIIGVMPKGFRFFSRTTQILLPLNWDQALNRELSWRNLRVVARLKEGVTLGQAQERVSVVSPRLDGSRLAATKGWHTELRPLSAVATTEFQPALVALLGAALGVLLIMCANLANLLLVKANGRLRELAVRSAMGASRFRIVRILLVESVLLSSLGCALGLTLCATLLPFLQSLLPPPGSADYSVARLLVQFDAVELDWGVALFAVACSLCAGLVFGLIPALRSSRLNLDEDLKDVGHGASGRRAPRALRVLAIGQVAVSLSLAIASTLLVRSAIELYRQGPGFESDGLLRLSVTWPDWSYSTTLPSAEQDNDERQRAVTALSRSFMDEIFRAVAAVPGVKSVAGGGPLGSNVGTGPYQVEWASVDPWSEPYWAFGGEVTPNYFETMSIPLLAGRNFDPSDRPGEPPVILINKEAADRYWPKGDFIGKRIRPVRFNPDSEWLTIVGAVGGVHLFGLDQPAPPTFYRSSTQWGGPVSGSTLFVRTSSSPSSLRTPITQAISRINPDTLIFGVTEANDVVNELNWGRRLATHLLAGLAILAVFLATVGIHGVVSHVVASRRREIGIRMALGANKGTVVGSVVGYALAICGSGAVAGLALAAGLTRFLQSLLFGVEPLDPLTFAIGALTLLTATLLASYIPARRAAQVDPMDALRHE